MFSWIECRPKLQRAVIGFRLHAAPGEMESEVFQEGSDEVPLRLDCVIEREDDCLRRDACGWTSHRPERCGEKSTALQGYATSSGITCAAAWPSCLKRPPWK